MQVTKQVVPVNVTGPGQSFRLEHDGKRVLRYYSSTGITRTGNHLFAGTDDECQAEMSRLGFPVVTAPYMAPTPARPVVISKLKLRRKLRELEWEADMDAFIAADPQRQHDYDDAQCLYLDDPLLAAAIPAFAQAKGRTVDEITQLLLSCAE